MLFFPHCFRRRAQRVYGSLIFAGFAGADKPDKDHVKSEFLIQLFEMEKPRRPFYCRKNFSLPPVFYKMHYLQCAKQYLLFTIFYRVIK